MYKAFQEQIKKSFQSAVGFFKAYLPHIVFLAFLFQLLSALNALPYFNIINKYYYYVFAIIWILANFLFKKHITNRRILLAGLSMFILAIPAVLIEQDSISDILGFAAFIFILTYVVRQVFNERIFLKSTIE